MGRHVYHNDIWFGPGPTGARRTGGWKLVGERQGHVKLN